MIVRSSNLATNLLVARVGARNIQESLEELGTTRMRVLRGVEDGRAYRHGINNLVTARDLMIVLAALAREEILGAPDDAEMVRILGEQEHRDLIPAGLPEGVAVANKTGRVTRIQHDAAIVRPASAPPFVLVVLTAGFEDPEQSAALIRRVAETVYSHHIVR
jgi:beta-lactamase class A